MKYRIRRKRNIYHVERRTWGMWKQVDYYFTEQDARVCLGIIQQHLVDDCEPHVLYEVEFDRAGNEAGSLRRVSE